MDNDNVLNFKSAGAKADAKRDATQGKQFGISNFFGWAMQKYPKLTLGQLQAKMPSLEREYAQEKALRKQEPNMVPSVNSAFDKESERKRAMGLESIQRMQKLAGIPITEDEVTKDVIGHVDAEADMLRKELFKIGKYSVELYKMLGKLPEGDFPHWWQAKIVKAGDYIGAAKHDLEGELYSPEEESPLDKEPEDKDDINPSGV